MKNFGKRVISTLLIAVLSVLIMSGCNTSKKTNAGDVKTLSFYLVSGTEPFNPDSPIMLEAQKKTGIRLKNTVSEVVTDENSAFATMLISKKLPDIVRSTNTNLKNMSMDGGLIALDKYFDDYAPNLKKYFEQCPTAKNLATLQDGHIYFVPGTTTDLDKPDTPSMGFFIRYDWLEKLGLETPKTVQELHDVLYAFKTKDPNGNGIDDEIPFFSRMSSVSQLFYLFNMKTDFFVKDNQPVFGAALEEYKNGIKELKKWYSEGIIDPEIYSRSQAREQLLGQNVGGCTIDWFSSTGKFNDSYAESIPGLSFKAMLPPKNVNGDVEWYDTRGVLHDFGWGISKDCSKEDIIAAVKYLDFWMSEEGCNLMAYGVEGVSYNKGSNGEIIWTDEAINHANGLPNYRRSIGFFETGTIGLMEAEKAGMNDVALEGYEMYEDIVKDIGLLNVYYAFNDEESKIYKKHITDINTYVLEKQQKWIMGKDDVDADWDEYIAELNNLGLDKVISVYKQAYDRY